MASAQSSPIEPGANPPNGASEPTNPTETPSTSEPTAPTSIIGDPPPPQADLFDPATFELPEGYDKGENFDAFAGVMKEFGVSQAKAKELVGFHTKAIDAALKSQVDAWHKQQGDWQREIQADSELGGSNFDNVKQTISRVLDNAELTDPGFREAVAFTGAGNHPAVVRTIYRWAKALSEGSSVAGTPPGRTRDGSLSAERPSPGVAIYGPAGPHTGGPRLS